MRSAVLSAPAFLWALYLLFPLHLLQFFRLTIHGLSIPIHYFFLAPPVLAAAIYATARRRPLRLRLLCWSLPLAVVGSIVFSSAPSWSLREWLSWISRGYGAGAVFFLLDEDRPTRERLIGWVYSAAVAAALFGLVELAVDRNPLVDHLRERRPPTVSEASHVFYRPDQVKPVPISERPTGTQGDRIPYVACLLPFLSLAIWKLRAEKKPRWKAGWPALALVAIILAARSRSGWTGLGALLTAQLLLDQKARAPALRALGGLALFSAAAFVVPASRAALLTRLDSDVKIAHRIASYAAVGALKGHLLFGVGYGQYPDAFRSFYHGPMPWMATPDNQYLRWLIETGLLGSLALAAFLGSIVIAGVEKIADMRDPRQAEFYKALLAGWVGIATTFVFFDGFYWGACNMTFWSFLGIFSTCLI